MITELLMREPVAAASAFVLVIIGCLGVAAAYQRWSPRRAPRVLGWFGGVATLPVLATTLIPVSRELEPFTCAVQFAVPTLERVEMLANIAVFVPATFFFTVALRRPLLVFAAGALAAALIEAAQSLAPAIGRSCDTNDWAMNTIGTMLGVILGQIVGRLSRQNAAAG